MSKSTLSKAELLGYLYLMALYKLATGIVTRTTMLDAKDFLLSQSVAVCTDCEKWMLADTICHRSRRIVTLEEFLQQAQIWEAFRLEMGKTTHMYISRVHAIRFHWHATHKGA